MRGTLARIGRVLAAGRSPSDVAWRVIVAFGILGMWSGGAVVFLILEPRA